MKIELMSGHSNLLAFFAFVVSLFMTADLLAQDYYGPTTGNTIRSMIFFSELREQDPLGEVYVDPATVEGTMYFDDKFHRGKIYREDEQIAVAQMRYNAYSDEVEVRIEESKDLQALMKNEKISCEFKDNKLVYRTFIDKKGKKKEGYLKILHEGDTYQLYLNQIMSFKEGQKPKTSFHLPAPDKFVDRSVFYISRTNEDPVYLIPSKKGVLSFIEPEHQKEVKAYIKEKNFDLTNQRDLIYLMMYIDSLAGS